MVLSSLPFLVSLLLLAAIFFWPRNRTVRRAVFTLANLAFVGLWLDTPIQAAVFAYFIAIGYGGTAMLVRRRSGTVLVAVLLLLLLPFLRAKEYGFFALWPGGGLEAGALSVVGLSYQLFKTVHVMVDCWQGQIKRVNFVCFLNYHACFATLLAGPIQRYQKFEEYWDGLEPCLDGAEELLDTYLRLFCGIIKIELLAHICGEQFLIWRGECLGAAAGGSELALGARALGMFFAYPAFVYLNFSGYCDIAISAARLLGLRLPENFDHPYRARNLIEFWTRWHITLGLWIRDYLFTPMYKTAAEKAPRQAARAAYGAYFTAFFLAGVWHGSTVNFVFFGLIHGAGVSLVKIYETYIVHRFGRKGLKRYRQIGWVHFLAVLVTLIYVCWSLVYFRSDYLLTLAAFDNVARIWIGG